MGCWYVCILCVRVCARVRAHTYMNMCACVRLCEGAFIRVLGFTLVSICVLFFACYVDFNICI